MQCFGPCFAPAAGRGLNGPETDIYGRPHATDRSSAAAAGWTEPVVHVHLNDATASPAAASSKADIRAKLGLGSRRNSGSRSSGSSRAGTSVLGPASNSGPAYSREQLRQEFLLQHGRNILAVSTLQQEGLQYFVMPGVGYLAYGLMHNGPEFLNKRTAVGLSDPVCDPQHYATMAAAFLQQHPEAMFAQVSAQFASVLEGCDFTINSMGGETRLDLATYNFTGYARRGLKSAIASATKEGITVQEVMQPPAGSLGEPLGQHSSDAAAAADTGHWGGAEWASLAQEMRAVDAKWAASKGGRASDFWFINRRPVFAPEPGVRKFVARDAQGCLQGYIFFDGVFEAGRLVGYYANVTRMLPDAHPGTLNLMMKAFIETVRSEAQLAAPTKKVSMRRSQRKKLEAAAAAAAATPAAGADSRSSTGGRDTASTDQRASAAVAAAPDSLQASAATAEPARPQFLSLGLSPFYQMDSSGFRSCPATHKALERTFEQGEGFYPFKTLAAAKAKYGAGLHDGKYEDAAVEYRQAYLCHRRGKAALVAIFDMAKFFGLWKHPADAFSRLLRHKIKTRLSKRRSSSSSSGGAGSAGSGTGLRRSSSMGAASMPSTGTGLTEQLCSKSSVSGGPVLQGAGKAGAAAAAAGPALQKQAADGAEVGGDASRLSRTSTASLIGTAPAPASVDSSVKRPSSSDGSSDEAEAGIASHTGISTGPCSEITECPEDTPSWVSGRSSSSWGLLGWTGKQAGK